MRKAIIIGATSGIGRSLALELSRRGFELGIAGRRVELLAELQRDLSGPSHIKALDVTQPEGAVSILEELIAELGGMELLVISSGISVRDPELEWEPQRQTLAVNVLGFTAVAIAGFRHFARQGGGHLAGITSVAGLRGSRFNTAYGASKAFQRSYLEGLRARARHLKLPIVVTDIIPGFVETPMTHGNKRMFWVADADAAARQIAEAIEKKKRLAYITRRWGIIAWIIRHLPGWLLERV